MSIKKSRDSFHDTFKKSISWGSWRVYEKLAVSTIWNYILMLSCVLCFSCWSYFFINIYFSVSLPMLLLGVKTGWQEIFIHQVLFLRSGIFPSVDSSCLFHVASPGRSDDPEKIRLQGKFRLSESRLRRVIRLSAKNSGTKLAKNMRYLHKQGHWRQTEFQSVYCILSRGLTGVRWPDGMRQALAVFAPDQ